MSGGESMGMPGQPAMGFGFGALTAVHRRVARAVDGGPVMGMGMNRVGHP